MLLVLMLAVSSCKKGYTYITHTVEAPFVMPEIHELVFPEKYFPITDYGAVEGDRQANTMAISMAIADCCKKGGGHVVIPKGTWKTGPIHLFSRVDLHLEEGSVLSFSDDPMDYLPPVQSSWEGLECYNYSPLVYAIGCEDVAITGSGMLRPDMDFWESWFDRPDSHLQALASLYEMASKDVPVEARQMASLENRMRPQLIQFNRCERVLLDGFTIRESPFWTIHMLMCREGIVRNLNVRAHGHNNDGIGLEMSQDFLVENCRFDQGDDAVVIKSGRNQDAWRLSMPTRNIVVRNCDIVEGHTLLGVGSEISGGVEHIYLHDCTVPEHVNRLFFVKTNHRRGGFVKDVWMKNVNAGSMDRVLELDTDVLYQWRDLVPTYETRITDIEGLHMENVHVKTCNAVLDLKGDERLEARQVYMKNVSADTVKSFFKRIRFTQDVHLEDVTSSVLLGEETMP